MEKSKVGEGCPLTAFSLFIFFSVQNYYMASPKNLFLSVELSDPVILFYGLVGSSQIPSTDALKPIHADLISSQ